MDQFQIVLQAILDKAGIEKSLKDVQTLAKQLPIEMTANLNATSTRNDFKKVANEMASDLNKSFNLNLTGKDIMSVYDQMISGAKKAAMAQDALSKQMTKSVSKIKELQSTGKISLDYSAVKKSYQSLEQVGTISNKLKGDFAQLKVSHDALGKSTTDEELVKNYTEFNVALNTVNNSLKQTKLNTSSVSSQSLQLQKITFENQIKTWLRLNSGAGEFKIRMSEIANKIKTVDNVGLSTLKQQFRAVNSEAQALGVLGKNIGDRFKEAASKFSMWFSTTAILMQTIRSIKSMWNSVFELDTALVDLKKTTNATASQLQEFYYSSNDIAKQLGVTTEEIIKATSAWSRLGYTIKDASTMAQNSAILSSISPDMDIDEATDGLVSSLKAFKIEAEDSLDGVVSKINIIGNTQAVDNGDIVDILTRSSSAMAEANNSLEQTIALGTAATEITRDAASVGTALKTVSMRIRGYDEETESYSENLENLSGIIANLTKTASSPGGISLFTDESKTTYKSTYEILKDISNIYDQLTDKNQAELLEALAGKRQGQIVAAMISNFSNAEKSMKSMAESTGNAMQEMNVIYDSSEYKLNRLKQTGVGISQNLFDSEGMKASIDTINKFAEIIDVLTEKLGFLGTISLIGGGILGAKNLGRAKMFAFRICRVQYVFFMIVKFSYCRL